MHQCAKAEVSGSDHDQRDDAPDDHDREDEPLEEVRSSIRCEHAFGLAVQRIAPPTRRPGIWDGEHETARKILAGLPSCWMTLDISAARRC
jgi:hypothetical protein